MLNRSKYSQVPTFFHANVPTVPTVPTVPNFSDMLYIKTYTICKV